MTSPTSTTPPKAPARLPIWKELIEDERRYREKLIKVRAKKRRMPTHAECLDAIKEVLAEKRERELGRKIITTAKVDGGAFRLIELRDGPVRIEEWKGGAWVPGGADMDEMLGFTPPITPAFAARLGIPPDDLA